MNEWNCCRCNRQLICVIITSEVGTGHWLFNCWAFGDIFYFFDASMQTDTMGPGRQLQVITLTEHFHKFIQSKSSCHAVCLHYLLHFGVLTVRAWKLSTRNSPSWCPLIKSKETTCGGRASLAVSTSHQPFCFKDTPSCTAVIWV